MNDRFAVGDVEGEAVGVDVAGVDHAEGGVDGDVAVGEGDVVDGHGGEAGDGAAGAGGAVHVGDVDVVDVGEGVGGGALGPDETPSEVEFDGVADVVEGDVFVGDVFDETAAGGL